MLDCVGWNMCARMCVLESVCSNVLVCVCVSLSVFSVRVLMCMCCYVFVRMYLLENVNLSVIVGQCVLECVC